MRKCKYTNENMIGKRFGKLVVKEIIEAKYRKDAQLRCDCDCGNKDILAPLKTVAAGTSLSCGCGSADTQFKNKINSYDLTSENYGIGFTFDGKNEFYFDKSDYEKIKNYCWFMKNEGYISTQMKIDGKPKEVKLHRFIMGLTFGDKHLIDHMNGIKNDNRKENLRIATPSNNCMNATHAPNSTSGVKGIVFSKEHNKYRARIIVNGKVIHLGYFENLDDAIVARNEAEEEYFGEFAESKRGNFLERALNLLTGKS